jgi:sulfofructose kinase
MGLAGLDLLGVLPGYPARNSKNRLTRFSVQGGGPAATASAAAARLGASARFVGKVADDGFGQTILDGLVDVGVDVSFAVVAAGGRSPVSFVAVDAGDGSRTVFHAPTDRPPLAPDEIDWACLDGVAVLLVDGRQPAAQLAAATRARAAGVKVVLDAEKLDDDTRGLLSLTDVCIASGELADELGGASSALDRLAGFGPEVVVVTLGENGSLGRADGRLVEQPALPVEVIDTTGCGDVYHGAFAVGLLAGRPLAGCMELAAAAAALKCRALGGRAGLPTAAEVEAFLRERRGR